jgi:anti-sigma regulatory factor (Ser/Thr protein kinase)
VAREWGLADLADIAELLVSELVTNAVRAAGRVRAGQPAVPVVQLWLFSDQVSLALHVWDGSGEMPLRRDTGPEADSGRGLMLVDALGKEWGTYQKDGGKVVWVLIGGP